MTLRFRAWDKLGKEMHKVSVLLILVAKAQELFV